MKPGGFFPDNRILVDFVSIRIREWATMKRPMNRRTFVQTTLCATGAVMTGAAHAAEPGAVLPKLPYSFDSLEPVIDARTMEIHHGKHHAAYVAGLNTALAGKPDLAGKPLEELLTGLPGIADDATRTALRNHGGGHWNHSLFWETMAPVGKGGAPVPKLREKIDASFGSTQAFQQVFSDAALKRFGSGWAWLILQNGTLKVTSTANQDNPLMKGIVPDSDLGTPLLGLDVWEHAYYLHYQNRRADYIKAWWDIVNWNRVSETFATLMKS